METKLDCSILIKLLQLPNKSKHINQIAQILETIPEIYKMVRTKGSTNLKDLIIQSEIITLNSNQQIYSVKKDIPIGFNILLVGKIDIFALINLKNQNKQIKLIGTLSPGETYGIQKQFNGKVINKLIVKQNSTILHLNYIDMYKLFDGVFIFSEFLIRQEQLKKVSLFQNLEKKDLLTIMKNSQKRSYLIHQTIYKEGDESNNLLMLEKGQVQLYKVGKRVVRKQRFVDKLPICILVTQGDLIGVQQTLQNSQYRYNAQCTSSSCIITYIPKSIINKIIRDKQKLIKSFDTVSKTRSIRIQTLAQLNKKIYAKQEIKQTKNNRISFQQKKKLLCPNKHHSKSLYITNAKENSNFDNQQQFYKFKVKQIQTFAVKKYGKQFKAKFVRLFDDDFYPPKKGSRQYIMLKKSARINNTTLTPRQTSSRQRSMSCSFYRLKKKVIDANAQNQKFIRTMTSFV